MGQAGPARPAAPGALLRALSGGMPASAPHVAAAAQAAQPGINPYTGKPLGSNEYVGYAGTEAEHPGMVRIPPPGWNDPSNPHYERRNYYLGPHGEIIAAEAGFQPGADHPYDTGRPGERNSELAGRGYQHIALSEPGVTPWGPGQQNPNNPHAPFHGPSGLNPTQAVSPSILRAIIGGGPAQLSQIAPGVFGAGGQQQPPAGLAEFLAALRAKAPRHPALPAARRRRRARSHKMVAA